MINKTISCVLTIGFMYVLFNFCNNLYVFYISIAIIPISTFIMFSSLINKINNKIQGEEYEYRFYEED